MRPLLIVLALLYCANAPADDLTIAVASNFSRTANELAERFTARSGIAVRLSSGSTGKLYAQIVNGAPFDVLLAADAERPARLEASGLAAASTRFTYATGRLVLWSRSASDCQAALRGIGRVALANPATAPYGVAARDYLVRAGLWESVGPRAVYGENIAQTLQFVATGNADVGFVAQAQLTDPRLPTGTCTFEIPAGDASVLRQQAVVLASADNKPEANRFVEFLKSDEALELIERHGYGVAR
jgi:molybdate transport system substrate-binding protein